MSVTKDVFLCFYEVKSIAKITKDTILHHKKQKFELTVHCELHPQIN